MINMIEKMFFIFSFSVSPRRLLCVLETVYCTPEGPMMPPYEFSLRVNRWEAP
jgi:hypothetical protein